MRAACIAHRITHVAGNHLEHTSTGSTPRTKPAPTRSLNRAPNRCRPCPRTSARRAPRRITEVPVRGTAFASGPSSPAPAAPTKTGARNGRGFTPRDLAAVEHAPAHGVAPATANVSSTMLELIELAADVPQARLIPGVSCYLHRTRSCRALWDAVLCPLADCRIAVAKLRRRPQRIAGSALASGGVRVAVLCVLGPVSCAWIARRGVAMRAWRVGRWAWPMALWVAQP
jgi:hypothetical protein